MLYLYFKHGYGGEETRMCQCNTEEDAFAFINTYLNEQLHFKSYYYNIHGDVKDGGKWIDYGSHIYFFVLREEN